MQRCSSFGQNAVDLQAHLIIVLQVGGSLPCASCGSIVGNSRNRALEVLLDTSKRKRKRRTESILTKAIISVSCNERITPHNPLLDLQTAPGHMQPTQSAIDSNQTPYLSTDAENTADHPREQQEHPSTHRASSNESDANLARELDRDSLRASSATAAGAAAEAAFPNRRSSVSPPCRPCQRRRPEIHPTAVYGAGRLCRARTVQRQYGRRRVHVAAARLWTLRPTTRPPQSLQSPAARRIRAGGAPPRPRAAR